MTIKYTSVKCPDCGANLPIEEGREQLFCSYCGASVIMTNENVHIYRHIDEAQIKKAEADSIIQLKKLEYAERKRASAEKVKKVKIIISIILGIVGIILLLSGAGKGGIVGLIALEMIMLIWIFSDKEEKDDEMDFGDKIRIPDSVLDYESKSYAAVESVLASVGFTNIRSVPLNDLTIGVLKKPGMVDSITINGHDVESEGEKYPPDATIPQRIAGIYRHLWGKTGQSAAFGTVGYYGFTTIEETKKRACISSPFSRVFRTFVAAP